MRNSWEGHTKATRAHVVVMTPAMSMLRASPCAAGKWLQLNATAYLGEYLAGIASCKEEEDAEPGSTRVKVLDRDLGHLSPVRRSNKIRETVNF